MNREALDFLDAIERADIVSDIGDLLDDAQVSVAVTYRDFQSRTFDAAAGTAASTYTDTATRAVRVELGAREIQAGAGLYQVGDVAFILAQSDLAATPHREDRIVSGGVTYEVLTWAADALGLMWRVVARAIS